MSDERPPAARAQQPCFLAFDVGCLHCGQSSRVIGVYGSHDEAQRAADAAEEEQRKDWSGQHAFDVYEIAVPQNAPQPAARGAALADECERAAQHLRENYPGLLAARILEDAAAALRERPPEGDVLAELRTHIFALPTYTVPAPQARPAEQWDALYVNRETVVRLIEALRVRPPEAAPAPSDDERCMWAPSEGVRCSNVGTHYERDEEAQQWRLTCDDCCGSSRDDERKCRPSEVLALGHSFIAQFGREACASALAASAPFGGAALRERIARALYECDRRDGTWALTWDAWIAMAPQTAAIYYERADAVLAVLGEAALADAPRVPEGEDG